MTIQEDVQYLYDKENYTMNILFTNEDFVKKYLSKELTIETNHNHGIYCRFANVK